jgi:hypothetical protein
MTAVAERLDRGLTSWQPQVAGEVERLVEEIIELADEDALDMLRSRRVEQKVLDILDDDKNR